MKRLVLLIACLLASMAYAQDFNKYTFNVGGGVGIPVGNTSNVAGVNGNAVVGGGLNFSRALGFTGEFMWHGLPPSTATLREINSATNTDTKANLYSVTGNFIFRAGGRLGAYVIGGGGWYHRNWEITAPTLVPGTVCGPTFGWWGVTCVNGLVEGTAQLRSGSANGGGLNIGGGFTFGQPTGAKFYTEVRYHHAYFSNFDTDVLPVTFGIRW